MTWQTPSSERIIDPKTGRFVSGGIVPRFVLTPEKRREYRIKSDFKLRSDLFGHYGGKCACCGYPDIMKKVHGQYFLEMDHINGGGRQSGIVGHKLWLWLRKNNYPPGFRVLCAGCNHSIEPGAEKCELHATTK